MAEGVARLPAAVKSKPEHGNCGKANQGIPPF